MARRNLSSGDLTADRRADYARMFAESGDLDAAIELMEQTLDLVPAWSTGWFQLGEYQEKAGRIADAVANYRRVLDHADEDLHGVGLKLALHDVEALPAAAPSAYIEGLFDDYAERFEESLVDKLNYTVPEELAALIVDFMGESCRFACAIDLGCGTGLFGAAFASHVALMEGYDLSEAMLSKAREKSVYAVLEKADLALPPEQSGLLAQGPAGRADLVSAADVMIYLGDLRAAFANAACLMAAGGIFAFSVEKSSEPDGFMLRESLRFAHSFAHIAEMLDEFGMAVVMSRETTIRDEGGIPIAGYLLLAQLSASIDDAVQAGIAEMPQDMSVLLT